MLYWIEFRQIHLETPETNYEDTNFINLSYIQK